MSLSGEQLKALARQGAAQRYKELQAELAALTATFPELARGGGGKRRTSAAPKSASRRRRSMNSAQRKEVSERMTRYWAARRAAKADGGGCGRQGQGSSSQVREEGRRVRRPAIRRAWSKAVPCPIRSASLHSSTPPSKRPWRGDFAAAARLLGEAARAQEAALGPDHLDLANTLNNLAVAHERSGQLDAAEREYRRAHAIAARTRPADDPLVTTSAQNLREFCEANGRPVDVPPSALTLADDTSDLLGADPVTLPVIARPQGHANPPTVPIAPLAITYAEPAPGQATTRSAEGRRLGADRGGAGETGRGTDTQAGACSSRGHDRAGTLGG